LNYFADERVQRAKFPTQRVKIHVAVGIVQKAVVPYSLNQKSGKTAVAKTPYKVQKILKI
jgi:hypothetical protein